MCFKTRRVRTRDFTVYTFWAKISLKTVIVRGGAVSEKTSLHSRLKSTVENKTPAFRQPSLLPRGICNTLYGISNFYPLANGIY